MKATLEKRGGKAPQNYQTVKIYPFPDIKRSALYTKKRELIKDNRQSWVKSDRVYQAAGGQSMGNSRYLASSAVTELMPSNPPEELAIFWAISRSMA